jgi:hypothetical protein
LGSAYDKGYRIPQHFDPEGLSFLHGATFKEAHEIVFAAYDAHGLGWCERNPHCGIRFRLSNNHPVVDTDVGVAAYVAIDSDDTQATVLWVCRPHHRSRPIAASNLYDVTAHKPKLAHGIHIYSCDTSSGVAMVRLDDLKGYFFCHSSIFS